MFCGFSPYTGGLPRHSIERAAEHANPAACLWRWASWHRTKLWLSCQPQDYVAWTVTGEISLDLQLAPGNSEIALHCTAEPLLRDSTTSTTALFCLGGGWGNCVSQSPKCSFVPARTWYLIMESDLWDYLVMRSSHFWGREWLDTDSSFHRLKKCITRLLSSWKKQSGTTRA